MAFNGRAPRTASGRRLPSRRPTTVAPMRRSGAATRSIGRLRSDASPVMTDQKGWPASTPTRSLAPVPELPQSITFSGSVSPSGPRPSTR
jgi:hypothetical protein